MKRTPLYNKHIECNGNIIDFAGWELPVQYTGLTQEHEAVRKKAGIFDVSHMGEILVEGKDAEAYLQKLLPHDVSSIVDNQILYTPMCNENGGIVDDLLVYKYTTEKYLLVVNASNIDKDFEWIKKHAFGDVKIVNLSEAYAQVAVQGPFAEKIVQSLTTEDLTKILFYHFKEGVEISGKEVLISRTGYTGEDGFEIYLKPEDVEHIWDEVLKAGEEYGIVPCGLGARDTLRFEVALPLYGNELADDITPYEAGIGFFVKLAKESDFIGKEALRKQKEEGAKRKLVGFEMIERGIARSHYDVNKDGKKIGHVTTGYMSPSLRKNIGLALIDAEHAVVGEEFNIVIRNKDVKAKIIKKPFYEKSYKK